MNAEPPTFDMLYDFSAVWMCDGVLRLDRH